MIKPTKAIKCLTFCIIVSAGMFLFSTSSVKALTVTPRVEVAADPGTTVWTEIKITNEERRSRIFYLRSENFNSKDETGNPSFSLRREGLATWINTPPSITLGPGQSIVMPVELIIPASAEPGGHFATVFFLTEPPEPIVDSGSVALGSKLGSLILLRVNGDFESGANILEFGTTGNKRFFSQLPIQFYYRFQNTGADFLKPVGDIQIKNIFGSTSKILSANTVDGSVLPKSVRRFTSVWTDLGGSEKQEPVVDLPESSPRSFWDTAVYQARHFTIGRYTASLEVAFGSKALESDSAKFVFYIIPWQLLVIVIPAFLFVIIFLIWLLKRYNRYIVRKAQNRLQ